MYLEVYVFNSPAVKEEQVYDEASLPDFPSNELLKKEIETIVPSIIWLNEEIGQIDILDFQGQLILENAKYKKIIYFQIEGGNDPFKIVLDLCRKNNWAAYTPENNNFLDPNIDTLKFWQEYNIYKSTIDQVFYKGKSSHLD